MTTPDTTSVPAPASRARDAVGRVGSIWSFTGRYRVLHLTWFAFFLSFVVWFNFAPFANTIQDQLGLTADQRKTIGLVNVALTVPARIFIGMALDRWGPRRVYAGILMFAIVPNTLFALAQTFETMLLSRLALSVVGAGFVVGIRMVSEWFPPREVGTAEGVYGGWGNFGSAAAAFSLPVLAGFLGGDEGWRWAIGMTGVVAFAYGLFYLRAVSDTPEGVTYAKPRRQGALEVTSRGGVFGLALLTVPLNLVLALIAWRIWDAGAISDPVFVGTLVAVGVLLLVQELAVFRVNKPALRDDYPESDQYPFRSVVALCIAYFATFGSELAVVTMLPAFFADTWGLGPAAAGVAASAFAFMNLMSRPTGGLLSDVLGSRKRTLGALLVGLLVGYVLLSGANAAWPWVLAVAACMFCSFFVQAGEGAVYAVVPLVKKRVSGQIAGLAGAFGNIGAIVFLTVGLYVSERVFFLVIAAAAVVAFVANLFLVEPANGFSHELLVDEDDRPAPATTATAEDADDDDVAEPGGEEAAAEVEPDHVPAPVGR
ncbi:MAG: NarK family nitrate/nitrite MFS transporter [Acidimicrobiales bacterium]